MKCPHCKSQVLCNLKSYKVHHDLSHPTKTFLCPNDCGRNYPLWANLSKHFAKCPKSVCEPSSSKSVHVEINNPLNEEVPVLGAPNEPEPIMSSKSCDFSSCLQEQADMFVANLYNKNRMPRQYVQSIIKSSTTFLSVKGYLII